MPTFDPNKTYIASVFDGILLKLRRDLLEYPDIAVNVGISEGDPNGVITGSPGDVRIDLVTPAIWQKITGELDEFGWSQIGTGGGGGGASVNDTFITYTINPDLPNQRVATSGTNISFDLTVPGQFIINAAGGAVTLQAAIDNQGAAPTEQAIVTSIDLNAGTGAWQWRDAADASLLTIADVAGVAVRQAFAIDGAISPGALAAGNTNDYAPAGLATANALRLTGDAAGSTLTGITDGASGRVLILFNIDTTPITLTHDDAASAGANRFLLPDNTSLTIPTNGSVVIWYDAATTRWRTAPAPGGSPQFNQPITTVGAGAGTIALVDLPAVGDRVVIRGLVVSSIFTAGAAAGDIGQIMFAGDLQAQNSTTDAQVVVFAPQPWGPPPGVAILQPTSTGYQPPLVFGSPGGLAIALNVVGTQIQITVTGIGGFTILTTVIGEIYTFGTAVRLVA